MRTILHAILVTSTCLLAAAELHAGCSRCGAQCATRRVCRTICTTKSVECTEWGEACREACLPPRSSAGGLSGLLSRFCGWGSGPGCDNPACDNPACDSPECGEFHEQAVLCDDPEGGLLAHHGPAHWFSRLHGSCDSRTRKKLMRKTIITQVPVTECIVEELCPQCCSVPPQAQPAGPPMTSPQFHAAPRVASGGLFAPAEAIATPLPAMNGQPVIAPMASQAAPLAAESKPFFQTVGDDDVPASGPDVLHDSAVAPASGVFFQQVGGEEPAEATLPLVAPAPLPPMARPEEADHGTLPFFRAKPLPSPAGLRSAAETLRKSAVPAGKTPNYAPVQGMPGMEPQPAGTRRASEL